LLVLSDGTWSVTADRVAEENAQGGEPVVAPSYDFDPVAVEKMLTWHLRRSREYYQLQPADQEDLVASAMEIFVRSYHTYDPAKSGLSTWTKYVARGALFRRREDRFTSKRGLGRTSVSLDELAEAHDGRPSNLPQMVTISHEIASIDRLAITQQLERLSARERQVINLRYFGDKTLAEVGKILGVTRERVRQIEGRALGLLRGYLASEKGRETAVRSTGKSQHVSTRVPLDAWEEALLELVARRTSLKELATTIGLSQGTARRRRGLLLEKIGASSYVGAAAYLEKVHRRASAAEEARPALGAELTARLGRVVHQKAKGPVDPALGKKIRDIRLARGMTQAQLAGEDFTKGFISLVETGRTRISLRAGEIFAARLGVPMSVLIPGGSAKSSILPNGLDGQVQEVLTLLRQGSEFSSSAFTSMLEISKDYTRIKAGVGKIQKMLAEAPVPVFRPDDVEAWMKTYTVWLRTIRAALEVEPETKKLVKV
jgi:RNA polymerase sigma factor (sigma-70 family)